MAELNTAFFDSDYQDVNEMLERAKSHPFKVPVDFETRFRVFKDQIISDRLHQVQITTANGMRYDPVENRTMKDFRNLYRRAEKEFMDVVNSPGLTAHVLRVHQSIYRHRKRELMKLSQYYYTAVIRILIEYYRIPDGGR